MIDNVFNWVIATLRTMVSMMALGHIVALILPQRVVLCVSYYSITYKCIIIQNKSYFKFGQNLI